MNGFKKLSSKGTIALTLVIFCGCVATLAPSYDQAIVNDLTNATPKILELYSSVSSKGATEENYSDFENQYNQLIGITEALALQTKARPAPDNKFIDKVNKKLEEKGVQAIDLSVAPSSNALQKISATIIKMRDTHKKQGVTDFEIQAFKGQTLIYLEQAITYERFLKR